MKQFLIFVCLLICDFIHAQNEISNEEKKLRTTGDFSEFLNAIKNNSTENCLCQQNEYTIFNFSTSSNKMASLCISKVITANYGHIIYRYGTKRKIELVYPTDTLNSLSKFQFLMYSRGGGKQNAGMELNNINFTNNNFTYTLYDDYYSEDESYLKGIMITNSSTGKEVRIGAKRNVIGHLSSFRDKNIVKFDPDGEAK